MLSLVSIDLWKTYKRFVTGRRRVERRGRNSERDKVVAQCLARVLAPGHARLEIHTEYRNMED